MAEPIFQDVDLSQYQDDPPSVFRKYARPSQPFVRSVPPAVRDALETLPDRQQPLDRPPPPIVRGDTSKIERALTTSATLDIPFSEAYDGDAIYTEKLKVEKPGFFDTSKSSLMRGIGHLFAGGGRALTLYAPEDSEASRIGSEFYKYGKRMQRAYVPLENFGELSWENAKNPNYWATRVMENIPVSGSLMVGSILGAYGIAGGLAATGLGLAGRTLIGAIGGGLLSSTVESAYEAADTYETAISSGMSVDEARSAADTSYRANMRLLSATNVAQLATAIVPMGKLIGREVAPILTRRILAAGGKVVGIGVSEGGEEMAQNLIQKYSLGKPVEVDIGTWEEGLFGAVFGLGLGGAGSVFQHIANHVESKMPLKMQDEFEAIKQQNISDGLDETTATVRALDTIAETPGGKTVIENAGKELNDIAEGKETEITTQEEMQSQIEELEQSEFIQQEADPIGEDVVEAIASGESSVDEVFELPALDIALTKEAPPAEFIITEDKYKQALAALKEKTTGLHAGIDPTVLGNYVTIGAYHIERGVRKFADWAKVMIERFGDAIEKHLPEIWKQSNDMVKRGVPSGLGERMEAVEAVKEVEGATQPAKDVKKQIRLTTGQQKLAKLIREDEALTAGLRKAEVAAREAYKSGKKEALEQAKAQFNDVLIRAKLKAEQFGFREGFKVAEKLTRKELIFAHKQAVEEAQQLRNVMRDIIEEELPVAERGKYLDAIIGKLTPRRRDKLVDRITERADTLEKEEAIDELKEIQSYKGEGKIPVEYQKRLKEIVGDINTKNFSPATVRKLESLQAYADENGMPSGVSRALLRKLDATSKKQASEMTLDEIQEINDVAKQLIEMGELKQKLINRYNERIKKQRLDKLTAGTKNIDYKDNSTVARATQDLALNYMPAAYSIQMGDKAIENFGPNFDMYMGMALATKEAKYMQRITVDSAFEEIEKVIPNFTDEQIVKLMINVRNQEGAENATLALMDKYGYQEVPTLTSKEQQVIDIMRKYASEMFTARTAAIFEELNGVPFPHHPNRIMALRYEGDPDIETIEGAVVDRHRTTQTRQGHTIARKPGVNEMPSTELFKIFEQDMHNQVWYIHMQPILDDVSQLIRTKEYRKAAGKAFTNFWVNYIDVVANQGWSSHAQQTPMATLLRKGRHNLTTARMGYAPVSAFMQIFSMFDSMSYAISKWGYRAGLDVMQETAKSWLVPGWSKAYAEGSKAIKLRAAGEVAMEELLTQIGRSKSYWDAFVRNSMKPLQKADVKTAAGAQSAYEKILKRQGLTDSRAKDEAGVLMEMANSSSDVTYRPLILSKGEAARTWFTFMTFFLARTSLLMYQLVYKGLVMGSFKKKMAATVGLAIMAAAGIAEKDSRDYLWRFFLRKKAGDKRTPSSFLRDVIYSVPSAIPYFGSIYDSFRGDTSEIPIMKFIADIFKSGKASVELGFQLFGAGKMKPETAGKALLHGAEAAATLGGIPGTAIMGDIIEGTLFPDKGGGENSKPVRATRATRATR